MGCASNVIAAGCLHRLAWRMRDTPSGRSVGRSVRRRGVEQRKMTESESGDRDEMRNTVRLLVSVATTV